MMTVTEGETAELPCIANGSPPPKITWIQEGRTMLVSGGRYDILDSGTLAINEVQARSSLFFEAYDITNPLPIFPVRAHINNLQN